jgi:SAM-dependent methyltransferase
MFDYWPALESRYFTHIKGYHSCNLFVRKMGKRIISNEIYQSPKKLNLGSSDRLLPNYINIDARASVHPDIVCNISKLEFASDNEFDLVRASHVLEHFEFREMESVLAEWRRVLRPGGYLMVCVPNFKAIAWSIILSQPIYKLDKATYEQGAINSIFALDLPPELRHKCLFSIATLKKLLSGSGFGCITRYNYFKEEPYTLGIPDDSCTAYSLNVCAIKI